jgi:SHS2 domain-containing protein
MTFSYEFLPGVALADVAFQVKADSWDQLFTGASEALTSVMVDMRDLASDRHLAINLSAPTVEDLLYDWLSEMVYLKDAEAFLAKSATVRVTPGAIWSATGTLNGDTIHPATQRLGQDIKAVTYHMFRVSREGEAMTAQVVVDI